MWGVEKHLYISAIPNAEIQMLGQVLVMSVSELLADANPHISTNIEVYGTLENRLTGGFLLIWCLGQSSSLLYTLGLNSTTHSIPYLSLNIANISLALSSIGTSTCPPLESPVNIFSASSLLSAST
jgi:hypothetical protein